MGMSEHELIQKLRLDASIDFIDDNFDSNLTMFQSHFLLFHHLYHLQTLLQKQQSGKLEISALSIRLSDYHAGKSELQQHDTLRNYYMDTTNLEKTTADDIAKMLDTFWQQYLDPTERKTALEILGLRDPVDDQTIKQTYRRLVMQHHPDRGGETERLQSLNQVIQILLR